MTRAGCAVLLLGVLLSAPAWAAGDAAPRRGPYLGEALPGLQAALFAPGFVCTGMNERDVAITPDGREIYFGVAFGRLATILVTRLEDGRWTEPAVAPFAADRKYLSFEPCLSADGSRLLFLTNRPTAGETARAGWGCQNIWAVDRQGGGRWGEPYDLGAPINSADFEFYPSLTRDGTLYFCRSRPDGERPVVMRARWVDGKFATPDTLPAAVNAKHAAYNAYIARDESYLIACVEGREDAVTAGRPNYYIFFRSPAGDWSEGVNLGAGVNFAGAGAASAGLSPDGRYFFFSSTRANEVVSSPAEPATSRSLQEYFAGPQNGNSDIYWMDAAFLASLRPVSKP